MSNSNDNDVVMPPIDVIEERLESKMLVNDEELAARIQANIEAFMAETGCVVHDHAVMMNDSILIHGMAHHSMHMMRHFNLAQILAGMKVRPMTSSIGRAALLMAELEAVLESHEADMTYCEVLTSLAAIMSLALNDALIKLREEERRRSGNRQDEKDGDDDKLIREFGASRGTA